MTPDDATERAARALLDTDNPYLGAQFPRNENLARWAAVTVLAAIDYEGLVRERDEAVEDRDIARLLAHRNSEAWHAAEAQVATLTAALREIAQEPNHWKEYDELGQEVGCVDECTGCIATAALGPSRPEPQCACGLPRHHVGPCAALSEGGE